MKRICVLGHFGEGETLLNGQTVKTKIVTEELQRRFGEAQVARIDTHGGRKVLMKAPIQVLRALHGSKNTVIFPAHNGLRVYAPLLAFFRRFFQGRKLHYAVIGGWLPQFLKKRRCLVRALMRFDGIYVETRTMKAALEEMGFANVFVMPNCKRLRVLSEEEMVYSLEAPYKLCTFSRVMREKGMEDAVFAVERANGILGYRAFSLDIYGQVDSAQVEWFEELKRRFPPEVRYCGSVAADESVDVLKEYFALLFPTRFYTEGIPGTVIDAYAAGIPVVFSKWESHGDVMEDGATGLGYDFADAEQLEKLLLDIARDPRRMLDMKKQCVRKAKEYLPDRAVSVLAERLQ